MTTTKFSEQFARALLRTLPGRRTVPPSTAEVRAVAYALQRYAREAAALERDARRSKQHRALRKDDPGASISPGRRPRART